MDRRDRRIEPIVEVPKPRGEARHEPTNITLPAMSSLLRTEAMPVHAEHTASRKVATAFCCSCHLQYEKPEMAKRYIGSPGHKEYEEAWVCSLCIAAFDKKQNKNRIVLAVLRGIFNSA